ncbi:uncharacterized protein BN818_00053 [Clostridium sp. CAG:964]|nr:uncharacterized protein BN818_00053 [Clostridium sp. CAG:964]
MLQMLKKKRFWEKLCTVLLCLVLCFTLVVNSVVDVFANPVAVGLFELILAILAACGITFGTVALAHDGVDAFTSGASSGVMDLLNSKLAEIATLAATAGVVYTIGINFLSEQWQMITADVVRIFGDYTAFDTVFDLTSQLDNNILSKDNPLKWSWYITADNYNKVSCNKFIFEFIGSNSSASSSLPSVLGKPSNGINAVSIGDFTFYSYNSYTSTAPISVYFSLNNSTYGGLIGFNFVGQTLGITSKYMYYKGKPVTATKVGQGYRLSTSICADIGKSLNLSDSICPDGIFSENTFAKWLLNIGNGVIGDDIPSVGALPGNPGIDTTAYPGNDTWHDGIDDVATGSPSIGISVPTDVSDDDIATLNPSKARDYSNADVKDKDVTTGDNDKPGDKDDDKDKTGTTPKVPAVSLPEILFKEKFPFCLPWDLYNLFAVLAAEPEAPKFVIPYKNNMLGIDEEYVLDFSKYEDAAKIIRFFTGAGFVLALILISRKLTGSE